MRRSLSLAALFAFTVSAALASPWGPRGYSVSNQAYLIKQILAHGKPELFDGLPAYRIGFVIYYEGSHPNKEACRKAQKTKEQRKYCADTRIDVVFVPSTKTLRAEVWGKGYKDKRITVVDEGAELAQKCSKGLCDRDPKRTGAASLFYRAQHMLANPNRTFRRVIGK